jgi:hypothetical protein
MRQFSGPQSADWHVRHARLRTQRKFSTEDKVRIFIAGLRGGASIANCAGGVGFSE